ncbi:hypothetical protein N8Z73_00020 [bacterium]|nr:hypothetical protein [bacterium]
MKKTLFFISFLLIIASFQSCSKYPENEGGSVLTRNTRLMNKEWVSTEVIISSIEKNYHEDVTQAYFYKYTFNRDKTWEGESAYVDSLNSQDSFSAKREGIWEWQNSKEEIYFPESIGGVWEIRRLDRNNLWVVSTQTFSDEVQEIKFEANN